MKRLQKHGNGNNEEDRQSKMIDHTGGQARRTIATVFFVTIMISSFSTISKSLSSSLQYAENLSTPINDSPRMLPQKVLDGTSRFLESSGTSREQQVKSVESQIVQVQEQLQRLQSPPPADPSSVLQNEFRPTWNEVSSSWNLPTTRFTHHIATMVEDWDPRYCRNHSQFWKWSTMTIDSLNNGKTSNNTLVSGGQWANDILTSVLKNRVFHDETLFFPNGTLQIQQEGGDYSGINAGDRKNKPCHFANSATNGYFCAYNIEDIKRWGYNSTFPPPQPWKDRLSVPVWRGKVWIGKGSLQRIRRLEKSIIVPKLHQNMSQAQEEFHDKIVKLYEHHKRLFLVQYSFRHPDLVDARISKPGELGQLLKNTTINGMDRYLPFDPIPENKYYSNYQVQIVMGGIGAAFRTARVMSQGIAVILQDFPFQEWYYRYMTPFVHYIPLHKGLQNITETLEWTRDHPEEVHQIAQNGKAYYEEYLSYSAMTEFYYELVFRMMVKSNSKMIDDS